MFLIIGVIVGLAIGIAGFILGLIVGKDSPTDAVKNGRTEQQDFDAACAIYASYKYLVHKYENKLFGFWEGTKYVKCKNENQCRDEINASVKEYNRISSKYNHLRDRSQNMNIVCQWNSIPVELEFL